MSMSQDAPLSFFPAWMQVNTSGKRKSFRSPDWNIPGSILLLSVQCIQCELHASIDGMHCIYTFLKPFLLVRLSTRRQQIPSTKTQFLSREDTLGKTGHLTLTSYTHCTNTGIYGDLKSVQHFSYQDFQLINLYISPQDINGQGWPGFVTPFRKCKHCRFVHTH